MTAIENLGGSQKGLIRLHYLWYVAAALLVMIVAIVAGNVWFLNWVHVMSDTVRLQGHLVLGPFATRTVLSWIEGVLVGQRARTAVTLAQGVGRWHNGPWGWT